MTQNKKFEDARPATNLKRKTLGHWVKVAVMILSGGFIFPHVLSEDEDVDISRHGAKEDAKIKRQ